MSLLLKYLRLPSPPSEQVEDIETFHPEVIRNKMRAFYDFDGQVPFAFDIYGDASFSDSIDDKNSPWYVFGIMSCSIYGRRWHRWTECHELDFAGHLHLSDSTPAERALLPAIIEQRFFDIAFIHIVHKQVFKRWAQVEMAKNHLLPPPGDFMTAWLWSYTTGAMAESIDRTFRRQHRHAYGFDCGRRIHQVVLNNRGNPDTEPMIRDSASLMGHNVEFRDGGHPGIDLVDGLCWAVKRALTHGEKHHLPAAFPLGLTISFPAMAELGMVCHNASDIVRLSKEIKQRHDSFQYEGFSEFDQRLQTMILQIKLRGEQPWWLRHKTK